MVPWAWFIANIVFRPNACNSKWSSPMCRRSPVSVIEHRYRLVKALTITSLQISWLQSTGAKLVFQVRVNTCYGSWFTVHVTESQFQYQSLKSSAQSIGSWCDRQVFMHCTGIYFTISLLLLRWWQAVCLMTGICNMILSCIPRQVLKHDSTYTFTCMHLIILDGCIIINPWRMHEGYSSHCVSEWVSVCVCYCASCYIPGLYVQNEVASSFL